MVIALQNGAGARMMNFHFPKIVISNSVAAFPVEVFMMRVQRVFFHNCQAALNDDDKFSPLSKAANR